MRQRKSIMAKATSKQLTTRLSEQAVQNLADIQASVGCNQTAAVEWAAAIGRAFLYEGVEAARETSRVAVEQNAAPDRLARR